MWTAREHYLGKNDLKNPSWNHPCKKRRAFYINIEMNRNNRWCDLPVELLEHIVWLTEDFVVAVSLRLPLLSRKLYDPNKHTVYWAVCMGHVEVIIWLQRIGKEGVVENVMEEAVERGHMRVVKWLHKYHGTCGSQREMDLAAVNEHLDILTWLHENGGEGCSKWAMNGAGSERAPERCEVVR